MSIFFFKQNAAYEMRISDWSSYVCSSDLEIHLHGNPIHGLDARVINRLGMARSFQITNIFPGLSVFENLRFGVDRKSVVKGKRASVRVDLGGRRIIKKNIIHI